MIEVIILYAKKYFMLKKHNYFLSNNIPFIYINGKRGKITRTHKYGYIIW